MRRLLAGLPTATHFLLQPLVDESQFNSRNRRLEPTSSYYDRRPTRLAISDGPGNNFAWRIPAFRKRGLETQILADAFRIHVDDSVPGTDR